MSKLSRLVVVGATMVVILFVFGGVARADECGANVHPYTFGGSIPTISGSFIENGAFDCADIQITDRVISSEFTLEVDEAGGAVLSDRMVFSNAGGVLNICIQSFLDSGNQTDTCDPAGTLIQKILPGDPAVEVLSTLSSVGLIFDVPTGQSWFATWTSQDTGSQSDFFSLQPIPEPGTLGLLSLGLLGLSRRLRRKG